MWELLRLFYSLGGIGWNPAQSWATFGTKAAAIQFKQAVPSWRVQFIEEAT